MGLSQEYGRERVFNTPLTEQASGFIGFTHPILKLYRVLQGLALVWLQWVILPLQKYNSVIISGQLSTKS